MTCLRTLTFGVLAVLSQVCVATEQWQALEPVSRTAQDYLTAYYQGLYPAYNLSIRVNQPDDRLKLRRCDKELTPSHSSLSPAGGQSTVRVSCNGAHPWNLYVSADVTIRAPVVHASTSLPKGEQLTDADLVLIEVPLDQAPRGFLLLKEEAIGMETRRSLRPQQALRARDLIEPMLIQRGDRVVVAANIGGLTVIAPGTALSNGRLGQQIPIENLRSERKIRAKVVAEGRVEVPM
ncbi:flagellar basal body P-ring formation chaperone FlgA [Simiduia agarivorans]|uniref:Flagella basal body P-ring formation protein FlgA n=1 Tax=Simiduia agarivorans (strain DSM 21679 / JCM 13881 / BCRC 17597 / SA1) TaxID=1117647 RepID=K4KUS4_SIMAS|nr:flagellar basal body P-ring formation chaperone FlgA [Simiduia agarivorans]AFU97657.1 flagellar basal body P-ring biosynthesis protein FlgA [Simiduia agarivorans SA1 = DSM 21679]